MIAAIDAAVEDTSASSEDSSALFEELWSRRDALDRDLAVAAIVDPTTEEATREILVDCLAGSEERVPLPADMRKVLTDHGVDDETMARIVLSFEFSGPDDVALLTRLTSEDSVVGFDAMKVLARISPATAQKIAVAIMLRGSAESDLRLSAAFKTLVGTDYTDNPANRVSLVRQLTSFMDSTASSEDLRDSALFALSDMQSLDAIKALLGSKRADPGLVGGAIDENATVLLTSLNSTTDPATLALVAEAMTLHPVCEFGDPLQAALQRVQAVTPDRRSDLANSVAAATDKIRTGCVPLNPRWTGR